MNIHFDKANGLIPVIVQDACTLQVLMLGYMNEAALIKTRELGKVTFYSRSRQQLWTKGETSGNYLIVHDMHIDCDHDTLLIKVNPIGPTCHTGMTSCFGEETAKGFLYQLQHTISQRIENNDEHSYTNTLFRQGINKIAQKVGEESVELIIEAKDNNTGLFKNEAADLLYHFLVLLKAKDLGLEDIEEVLLRRSLQ